MPTNEAAISDFAPAVLGGQNPFGSIDPDLSATWRDLSSLASRSLLAVPPERMAARIGEMTGTHRRRWRTLRAIASLPGTLRVQGAREVMTPGTVPNLTLILNAAADMTGVSVARLTSGARESDTAKARGLAAWTAREAFGHPVARIASALSLSVSGTALASDRARALISRYPAAARTVMAIADEAERKALENYEEHGILSLKGETS